MSTTPDEPVAVTGDAAAAFADLYDDTVGRVYGFVLEAVADQEQAAEITGEVYLEVWRATGEGATSARTSHLMVVAHRLVAARLRRRTDPLARTCGGEACPRMRARDEVRSGAQPAGDALALLSVTQRRAIEMSYFCAHTPAEVAQVLGIAVDTATQQIRQGLLLLGRTRVSRATEGRSAHVPMPPEPEGPT